LIYYVNKRSISESDPFSFAFLMSVGLCISNYILSFISSKRLIIHIPKGVASNLVTLGILTGTSFAFVSFGYTLIPLSGVSAILAVVPFIALLVSKYKFNEEKLLPKLVASAIAFVGVLIMVLPR
jgi:drug/metabolite transporter (DMT)-like permease